MHSLDESAPAMSSSPWIHHSFRRKAPRYPICQDSCCSLMVDDAIVLVVADGAGSAARSAEGSALAIELAQAAVQEVPEIGGWKDMHEFLGRSIETVGTGWEKRVSELGSPEQFDTTFALAIYRSGMLGVVSVGDAFALLLGSTGKSELVVAPDRPDPTSGSQTWMLADWANEARRVVVQDATARAIMLSTDGLEGLLSQGIVDLDGEFTRVFLGTHDFLDGVLGVLVQRMDLTDAARLAEDDIMSLKGDDIGFALAIRDTGLRAPAEGDAAANAR